MSCVQTPIKYLATQPHIVFRSISKERGEKRHKALLSNSYQYESDVQSFEQPKFQTWSLSKPKEQRVLPVEFSLLSDVFYLTGKQWSNGPGAQPAWTHSYLNKHSPWKPLSLPDLNEAQRPASGHSLIPPLF